MITKQRPLSLKVVVYWSTSRLRWMNEYTTISSWYTSQRNNNWMNRTVVIAVHDNPIRVEILIGLSHEFLGLMIILETSTILPFKIFYYDRCNYCNCISCLETQYVNIAISRTRIKSDTLWLIMSIPYMFLYTSMTFQLELYHPWKRGSRVISHKVPQKSVTATMAV